MFRDLSQPISSGIQTYPGDPPVDVSPAATVDDDGYRVSALACGSHSGTHVDAPSHTEPAGSSLDEHDVGRFVFDARVVDCTGREPRTPIGPDALPGDDAGDLLVVRTGWDAHWGTDRYLDHPYLTPEAADRCVRAGWSVGVDALNPDPTPSPNAIDDEPSGFPTHARLLGAERFILENLTNLAGLDRFRLYAFPLPIEDADGSPVRAVAAVSPS